MTRTAFAGTVRASRVRWAAAAALGLVCLAPTGVTPADAATRGSLSQLRSRAGCVAARAPGCGHGRAIREPFDVAISPDGRNAYVASVKDNAIAVFARNRRTGALRQLAGKSGCIRHRGGLGCTAGRALADPWQLRVSPDGRNVYAASRTSHVVDVFRRNRRTGALAQLGGRAGCLSRFRGGGCARARAIAGAAAVRISPDGRNVYVAAVGSNAVAIFRRNGRTGALAQLSGPAGCISQLPGGGCAQGRALKGAIDAALSRDGRTLFVASIRSGGLAIFRRGSGGALSQLPGTAGCMTQGGTEGCASGRALSALLSVVPSPDGKNVYTAAANAVGVFARSSLTGALSQSPGREGCISQTAPSCTGARSADDATWIVLSPDGRNMYMASFGRVTLGVFTRSSTTGALAELGGPAGCLGPTSVFGCRRARAVSDPLSVAVSGDGRNLYTASTGSDAIAVFRRAP